MADRNDPIIKIVRSIVFSESVKTDLIRGKEVYTAITDDGEEVRFFLAGNALRFFDARKPFPRPLRSKESVYGIRRLSDAIRRLEEKTEYFRIELERIGKSR